MKKALLLAIALMLIFNASAMAQERGPLVMQIEFEWTVAGIFAGVAVGFMIWLTDPAGPLPIGEAMASGAAWGALAGAGFGVFTMQRTVRLPTRIALDTGEDFSHAPFVAKASPLPAEVLAGGASSFTSDGMDTANFSVSAPQKFPTLAMAPGGFRNNTPSRRGVSIPLLTLRF